MQNSSSIFHHNSFQFSNSIFVLFNTLSFKFIQLRLLYQLLLYVAVNFSIFLIFFLHIFQIKKIQLMIEKYFPQFF